MPKQFMDLEQMFNLRDIKALLQVIDAFDGEEKTVYQIHECLDCSLTNTYRLIYKLVEWGICYESKKLTVNSGHTRTITYYRCRIANVKVKFDHIGKSGVMGTSEVPLVSR